MKAVLAQVVSCLVYDKPLKNMQHMHGIIPYIFACCANPVDHLLLLKTSMPYLIWTTKVLREKIGMFQSRWLNLEQGEFVLKFQMILMQSI